MVRAFETHKIRKTKELSSCLWNFHTLINEEAGEDRTVFVPSCWETYPDTLKHRGKGVYTREFTAQGNVRLEFKGVSHTAQVFVDGELVAAHYNAYTPFVAVIRDLKAGKHKLEVIADNSFGPDSALHVPNDYQSYGGISRAVVCEEVAGTFVEWIHFTPICKENGWYGKIEVSLCNLKEEIFEGKLEICVDDVQTVKMPVTVVPGAGNVIALGEFFFEHAREWCPESPELTYITANLEDAEGKIMNSIYIPHLKWGPRQSRGVA